MGTNRQTITAGDYYSKYELETTVITNPGEVLMNTVDDGEVKLTNATADAIPYPIKVVDYTSVDGMDSPWRNIARTDWERDIYAVGDQVPYIVPYRGMHVMVMADTGTTWQVGDYVACNGDGQVKVGTGPEDSFAICLEDLEVTTINQHIKVEVIV